MSRPIIYNLRLSDEEYEKVKAYASTKQITVAEIFRQYIWSLPKVKVDLEN